MYCNKCGNEISPGQRYCGKCGSPIVAEQKIKIGNDINKIRDSQQNKIIVALIIVTILFIIGIIIYIFLPIDRNNYYFNDNIKNDAQNNMPEQKGSSTSGKQNTTTKGKYKTAIITDNVYSGLSISGIQDAQNLVVKDSVDQKQSDYPQEIIDIENDIIQKYSITAVNLKEMDVEFAKELENVIATVYTDFPEAKGYLTNLTLTNLSITDKSVIALFMPIFMFGMSDTGTTRPWVIKTQVQLNAAYFLNPDRLDQATQVSSESGHFPENSTRYSPVAHEFGHYLSFIAILNHYSRNNILLVNDSDIQSYYEVMRDFQYGTLSKQMLDEAYQNYIRDFGNIGFDEWRGEISQYALAKDERGEYIYDETIAEAFHDVYLNGENAKRPSKYIVEVLKKYVRG